MAQILLIEPDKILAGHIQAYFANADHKVAAHTDLQQAIAAVDKAKLSLVIMELQLAGRSGIEFLYEFRSYPDLQRVPVIIYSSLKQEEIAVYSNVFRDLGIDRILYKPEASLRVLLEAAVNCLAPAAV